MNRDRTVRADPATPLTCSEGLGALPPQLAGRGAAPRVLPEPRPQEPGCEVVTAGRDLPQGRGLAGDLTSQQTT